MKTLLLTAALAASGCTGQALCAKQAECADDPPGDDFQRICEIRYDGDLRALRANKEDECHAFAAAKERLDACRAQLDCDDFQEADLGGKCDDEIDDFQDAFEDIDDDCSSRD
jgi:hypothetical protein